MKKSLLILFFYVGMVSFAVGQPEKISYQGMLRNSSGVPITNTQIRLRLSILDSIMNGSSLYTETHITTTTSGGQFNIFIGGGVPVSQSFASIPWSNGRDKFLKLELDAQGGTNFQPFGTAPLLSVPFALHAQSANEVKEGAIIRGNNGETYQISVGSNGPAWNCNPPVTTANAGANQLNLPGIVFNLTGNQPGTSNSGTWSVLSGTGGIIENSSTYNSTFIRGNDSIYSLIWKMQSACGTSRDTATLRFAALIENQSCLGSTSLSYLGNNYPIVRIGNQCWMAKNLDVGSMLVGSSNPSNNAVIEKFCYNDQLSNCSTYGGMYLWAEAVQYQNGASSTSSPTPSFAGSKIQGICPSGWHIPSKEDWCTMVNYYDATRSCGTTGTSFSYVGGVLKSLSNWNSPNGGATNRSGFSAVSNGYRYPQGTFLGLGNDAGFWTSSNSNGEAVYFWLDYQLSSIGIENGNKITGNAVRCVKDTLCSPTTSSAGPDQLSLSGSTATLAANTPAAGETGTWTITTGSGATLSNVNSPTATFTKGTDSAYTLVWTIAGPCGTSRDTVHLRFPSPVGTTCGQAVNYAGESYPTVKIGPQCWLAKNLNVGTMINGSVDQSNNSSLEKYCFNNDPANCVTYGGLYQWGETVQYKNGASNTTSPNPPYSENVQGICPTGWHLPLEYEWTALETYLGNPVGGALKSTSNLWTSNTGATNSSGFSALPSGTRYHDGTFGGQGVETSFWSSSEFIPNINGTIRKLINSSSSILAGYSIKNYGIPVRCIKDSICSPTPASAGPDLLNLSGASVNIVANPLGIGETGKWNVIAGSGVPDNSFNSPNITFNKAADNAYTLVWIITGACGISRDTMNISFGTSPSNNPCLGATTISHLGEEYASVMIGSQCWLGRNLNVGTRVDGLNNQTNNGITEKYCHNNDPNYCSIYGGMYQWAEAINYQNGATNLTSPSPVLPNKVRGICPTGWHLPTDAEFCTFSKFLDPSSNCTAIGTTSSTLAGGSMKSVSNLWFAPNTGANNSSGFSGLPGGSRLPSGLFTSNEKLNGIFWTSSETDFSTVSAFSRALEWNSSSLIRGASGKEHGFAVRCIKDTICAPTTSSAGPDQLNLSGTTATLAANAPASGETGVWSIVIGSGGSLSSASSRTATFTKGTDSAYTLVWTISGSCGTTRDTMNLRFPAPVGTVCGQTITYAGESYPTVQIGTQCWFQKNLNVGTMINGSSNQTNNATLEKYCYNNDPVQCTVYGGLYQWAEAVQYQNGASNTTSPSPAYTGNVRGICPAGWHLPSFSEFNYLEVTFGGPNLAGGAIKSTNAALWDSPNTGATNSSGFSADPGGFRSDVGLNFTWARKSAYFYSSSENSSSTVFSSAVDYSNTLFSFPTNNKSFGYSVRCIKD